MSWMEFVSGLVWPMVVLVIFFALVKPIRATLDGLGLSNVKFAAAGIEASAEWTKQVNELAEEAAELAVDAPAPASGSADSAVKPWRETMIEVAAIDPRAAVLSSFATVEKELRDVHERTMPKETSNRVPGRQSRMAFQVLDGEDLQLFVQSMQLRNTLAHSALEIGIDQAVDFVHVMSRVLAVLQEKYEESTDAEP